MDYQESFVPIAIEDLVETATQYKADGYRLSQMMSVLKEDDTIWLYYTFIKGNEIINRRIEGVIKGETEIPSLTPLYLSIFVNENEAHDLYGVNIVGNILDFNGAFYSFGQDIEAPMTIISPAQLAAREKAAKIAKAKAAKAAKAAKEVKETKTQKSQQDKPRNAATNEGSTQDKSGSDGEDNKGDTQPIKKVETGAVASGSNSTQDETTVVNEREEEE